VLYRVIKGEYFGVGSDTLIPGGGIQVYHREQYSEEACDNLIQGVWEPDNEGEKIMITEVANEGDGRTITHQIQEWSCFTVRTVWRELHPPNTDDVVVGDILEVEHEEKPNTMTIKINYGEETFEMVALVRPLEELFKLLRAEFGWQEKWEFYFEKDGKRATYDQVLPGSSWNLKASKGEIEWPELGIQERRIGHEFHIQMGGKSSNMFMNRLREISN
jgi:hypothetical protein